MARVVIREHDRLSATTGQGRAGVVVHLEKAGVVVFAIDPHRVAADDDVAGAYVARRPGESERHGEPLRRGVGRVGLLPVDLEEL
jgi:hypothetical protein